MATQISVVSLFWKIGVFQVKRWDAKIGSSGKEEEKNHKRIERVCIRSLEYGQQNLLSSSHDGIIIHQGRKRQYVQNQRTTSKSIRRRSNKPTQNFYNPRWVELKRSKFVCTGTLFTYFSLFAFLKNEKGTKLKSLDYQPNDQIRGNFV